MSSYTLQDLAMSNQTDNQRGKHVLKELAYDHSVSQFDNLPDGAYVSRHVIERLLEVSRATVWNMSKDGRLPKPVTVLGLTRWRVGDLREAMKLGMHQDEPVVQEDRSTSCIENWSAWDKTELGRMQWSTRTANVLKRLNVTTVAEVRELTDNQILSVKGCGKYSVIEIRDAIPHVRLTYKEDSA